MAVLVADRLTKPQKPKRKKLAPESGAMLLNFSGVKARRPNSSSRCSNSFSFLTTFAPPLTGHQQGRPPQVEAWDSIQHYWAYRQGWNLLGKLKLRDLYLKTSALSLLLSFICPSNLVALPGTPNVACNHQLRPWHRPRTSPLMAVKKCKLYEPPPDGYLTKKLL